MRDETPEITPALSPEEWADEYPLLRPVALKIAALLAPTADDGTP